MAAKLLILGYLVNGELTGLPDGFLPFVSVLGHFNGSGTYRLALQAVIVISAVVLWLNRAPRTCCLLIGLTFLLAILSSQPYYHNNLLYLGLFYLIVGLWDPRAGTFILRLQLAVVYLGAALNKVLLSDWRTGWFVRDWLKHYPTAHLYAHAAALLPGTLLSALLSWLAIVTEFALIPSLLIRRYVPLAVFAGISYHTGLVLITGGSTFNTFWFSLVATYIALLDWPSGLLARYNPEKGLHRIAHSVLAPFDADRLVTWYPAQVARLELTSDTAAYTGIAAGARLLMYSPVFYLCCAIVFNLTAFHYHSMVIPFVVYGLIAGISFGYAGRIRVISAPAGRHARQRW